ncbi:hypothetical protein [Mesorhizobium sp. WSM2239]|uniref:Uncharacterized protein n=2 Tax=unclassified Mesorhizobium TaxID=325217 RepID=A0AAU8D2B8_9HYPH
MNKKKRDIAYEAVKSVHDGPLPSFCDDIEDEAFEEYERRHWSEEQLLETPHAGTA